MCLASSVGKLDLNPMPSDPDVPMRRTRRELAPRPRGARANRCGCLAPSIGSVVVVSDLGGLNPCTAMVRAFAVVFDDQNPDLVRTGAVDHRIRKDAHGKTSPIAGSWRSDRRVLDEKARKPLELGYTSCRQNGGALALVEGGSLLDVLLSARVKRDFHPGNRASSLAIATSRGTGCTAPVSNSPSRWSARASQAASASPSTSRLAISLSRSRALSAGDRRSASACSVSKVDDIGFS